MLFGQLTCLPPTGIRTSRWYGNSAVAAAHYYTEHHGSTNNDGVGGCGELGTHHSFWAWPWAVLGFAGKLYFLASTSAPMVVPGLA